MGHELTNLKTKQKQKSTDYSSGSEVKLLSSTRFSTSTFFLSTDVAVLYTDSLFIHSSFLASPCDYQGIQEVIALHEVIALQEDIALPANCRLTFDSCRIDRCESGISLCQESEQAYLTKCQTILLP